MHQIKTIVDVGSQFGMTVSNIFDEWDNPVNIIHPQGLSAFVDCMQEADLVMFGGGEDIHPAMYGHDVHGSHVFVNGSLSMRDRLEREIFRRCVEKGIPILGICRGAQLACVCSGGKMIQDVRGHAGADHKMKTPEGITIPMNSFHHQMMFPDQVIHEMLGWTTNVTNGGANFDYHKMPPIEKSWFLKEPEILYFPKTNSLAVQAHPEWMDINSKGVQYVLGLVRSKLMK